MLKLHVCPCARLGRGVAAAGLRRATPIFLPFVAAVDPLDAPALEGHTSKLFGMNLRDVLLLACMAFIFGAALFLWAYLTRKKGRNTIALAHSHGIYRGESPSRDRERSRERERDTEEESERRRYRKKRRRRQHPELLPRNPTLQETGGLPPLRPEEPPAEPTQ